jgi:hypothetical protein
MKARARLAELLCKRFRCVEALEVAELISDDHKFTYSGFSQKEFVGHIKLMATWEVQRNKLGRPTRQSTQVPVDRVNSVDLPFSTFWEQYALRSKPVVIKNHPIKSITSQDIISACPNYELSIKIRYV